MSGLKRLMGVGLSVLNRRWPKRSRRVALNSLPDFDDAAIALAIELNSRGYDVCLLVRGLTLSHPLLPENVRVKKQLSWAGVLWFLSSKWVFVTHSMFAHAPTPSNQTCVNVWHGMPIKSIGTFVRGHARSGETGPLPFDRLFDRMVANDTRYRRVLARALKFPEDKIIVCGSPRNGNLIANPTVKRMLGISGRLGIWLPTWRERNSTGSEREDEQSPDTFVAITQTRSINLGTLNKFLEDEDFTVLVKAHPHAAGSAPVKLSRLITIDEVWLADRGLSLYRLLGGADVLITDISSVYNDFKTENGSVIVYMDDFDEYVSDRGLCFDRFEDVVSEPVLSSQEELHAALQEVTTRVDPRVGDAPSSVSTLANTKKLLDQLGC